MAAKFADWGRLFPLRLRPSPRAWLSGGGDEYGGDYQLLRQRRPKPPPKGHLVVYVPRDGGERPHRAVVPVVYFNHPLFGELLRKVETEFGFQQSGGITIPCPVSDFESICTAVAAEVGRRRSGSSAARLPRQLLSLTGRRPIVQQTCDYI
ncbi:unnamed protein product [Spirodela intermedia]|uniref:Uncharacterized protein n=1 Tax=Spirodela intermedia TaxID=51605 RepID=A0A7I8L0V9_SPIIN|nr:unnamed protein product [Spirodela intermedia]